MEEKFYTCPYCQQSVSTLLDIGFEGETTLIDDCEVCCRPIEISYYVEAGYITNFVFHAIDGNAF